VKERGLSFFDEKRVDTQSSLNRSESRFGVPSEE
jgi:hypothetical protein